MDEQPMRQQGHMGSNTGGGTTTLDQNRTQQQSGTTANQAMEQAKTTANQAMEQAKTMARNIGDQAAAAAADPTATAQELARRAREQAGAAGDVLYRQGQRAGEYLTQNVNEYPLTALLIAGMIGYGLAYLVHSQWQGQMSWPSDR
jgi:vacuolar-type H+-ATPase subunit H